jgi:hypothetical protein
MHHDDSLSGVKSFMYGKSISNQRIESWWGRLRKWGGQFWINFFKDLIDSGHYDTSNQLHIECARFCFMNLIREDLKTVAEEWNLHDIRKQKCHEGPYGKPELMYSLPQLFGAIDCGYPISVSEVQNCLDIYGRETFQIGCSDSFVNIIELIIPNCQKPQTPEIAKNMFIHILDTINQCIH